MECEFCVNYKCRLFTNGNFCCLLMNDDNPRFKIHSKNSQHDPICLCDNFIFIFVCKNKFMRILDFEMKVCPGVFVETLTVQFEAV